LTESNCLNTRDCFHNCRFAM